MFCSNCGSKLDDDALFCINCGTKVEEPDIEAKAQEPVMMEEPAFTGMPVAEAPQPEYEPMHGKAKKAKKDKKGKGGTIALIIIICVLCAAIVGGIVFFILSQKKKTEQMDAFKAKVEAFAAYLDGVNYTSVEEDVDKLMKDCDRAIKEESLDRMEALDKRMVQLQEELDKIAGTLNSLEAMRDKNRALLEEKYYVSDELYDYAEEQFAALQSAIDSGEPVNIQEYEQLMSELLKRVGEDNEARIQTLTDEANAIVKEFDEVLNEDDRAMVESYLSECSSLQDAGDFKGAHTKAMEFLETMEDMRPGLEERMEKQRQESIEAEREANGGYICPGSDIRYLTEEDVAGLSSWELLLARNEIYARHGRLFQDEKIQKYFDGCDWYDGHISPDNFNANVFNEYEKANISFIQEHEE